MAAGFMDKICFVNRHLWILKFIFSACFVLCIGGYLGFFTGSCNWCCNGVEGVSEVNLSTHRFTSFSGDTSVDVGHYPEVFCTAVQDSSDFEFQKKVEQARLYCQLNALDTQVCVLIDMSIHSGKKRLFVVDLIHGGMHKAGLCAHGSCDGVTAPAQVESSIQFSNVPSSYCSSVGKYRIGSRSWSNWGIKVHYKLHGLDSSNSNAFKRTVVLHSYRGVSNEEVFPDHMMNSWGCPMVSDLMMGYLDSLLKPKKKVLLWVHD